VHSSGDEASLSADSSDDGQDVAYIMGTRRRSGSYDDTIDAIGMESNSDGGYSGSHYCSATPDPTPSLQKIDESERDLNGDTIHDNIRQVSGQDLGYSPAPEQTTTEENGGTRSPKSETEGANAAASQGSAPRRIRRMGNSKSWSTPSVPEGVAGYDMLRGSMIRQRRASIAVGDHLIKRLQRRLSAASSTKTGGDLVSTKKFRQRLGIMRSVDLGGETIENYTRKGSIGPASIGRGSLAKLKHLEEHDEPDELRATVILETMLLCSDVAHNMQGWDHMLKWSHRLYWELLDANKAGRGFDPSQGWCSGQTGFLQNYMLPLAQKLGRSGVFGHQAGQVFANTVQSNLDTWEIEGEEVSAILMNKRTIDRYPFR
jgi:hypothetical protein